MRIFFHRKSHRKIVPRLNMRLISIWKVLHRKAAQPPSPSRLGLGSQRGNSSSSLLKAGSPSLSLALCFSPLIAICSRPHVRCRRKRKRSRWRRHTWSKIMSTRMIWFRSCEIDLERSLGFGYVPTLMITWRVGGEVEEFSFDWHVPRRHSRTAVKWWKRRESWARWEKMDTATRTRLTKSRKKSSGWDNWRKTGSRGRVCSATDGAGQQQTAYPSKADLRLGQDTGCQNGTWPLFSLI